MLLWQLQSEINRDYFEYSLLHQETLRFPEIEYDLLGRVRVVSTV